MDVFMRLIIRAIKGKNNVPQRTKKILKFSLCIFFILIFQFQNEN